MKKIIGLHCLLMLLTASLWAQQYKYPENNYTSKENKYYWKNRIPYEGYYQQDVHYTIEADVVDSYDIVIGKEWLTYTNNSPDTLSFAYFHLYQNAFQPGSYLDMLTKENGERARYGEYEKIGFGTLIKTIRANNEEVKTEYNNTIMKAYFNKPLRPNESIKFYIEFNSYFDPEGGVRRRMKLFKHDGVKHYDGVHWYPRISVYDRKFGWTTDQHLGKEFYGDFGTYDVSLTLPHEYVLEATGELLNEEEAMPEDLRKKLDLSNFKDGWKGKLTEFLQPGLKKKTWRFHAGNVHDFAWTADPSYRIGETEWNGVKIVCLAQEPIAGGCIKTPEFIKKVIQTYSADFGMYAWPKIVVADARDGMEYPMLTLCGGADPGNHFVIAHEVGHEWFFGMIGNNETYRAFLDEGFTQFLTVWSMNKILGEYPDYRTPKDFYLRKFSTRQTSRMQSVYYPYLRTAVSMDNTTLNTHSDDYNGALGHGGGYGMVYYKTATMLYNLQYVLGDELFGKAMQNYFDQWKIAHPYPEDFRNSIIQYTHTDLNWFFDQWLETDKTIDYGICKLKKDSADWYTVTFRRYGKMQMPLDFTVITKDCKKIGFHIPNDYFVKKTDATVLPAWIGWDKLQPTYKAHIRVEGKIKNIIIDTTWRIADANMLNNSLKHPVKWKFDAQVNNTPDRRYYEMYYRPDVWYNGVDGVKAGINFTGNYFNMRHFFDATIWVNTTLGMDKKFTGTSHEPVNFRLSYRDNFFNADRNLSWNASARLVDGLYSGKLGIEKKLSGKNSIDVFIKTLYRSSSDYLFSPAEWVEKKHNNTFNIHYAHPYKMGYGGYGTLHLYMKNSSLLSDYAYTSLEAQLHQQIFLKNIIFWKWRLYANYTEGSNIAPESKVFLAGANPEEMMENKFTRSVGLLPGTWMGYGTRVNHFHTSGGMNLRGYTGYLASEKNDSGFFFTYKGTSALAFNNEWVLWYRPSFTIPVVNLKTSMSAYAFYDAGIINYATYGKLPSFANIRMDAGLGTTLSIDNWGRRLQKTEPITIRFDMPLFLNATPATEPEHFKFRWVLGIGRAF